MSNAESAPTTTPTPDVAALIERLREAATQVSESARRARWGEALAVAVKDPQYLHTELLAAAKALTSQQAEIERLGARIEDEVAAHQVACDMRDAAESQRDRLADALRDARAFMADVMEQRGDSGVSILIRAADAALASSPADMGAPAYVPPQTASEAIERMRADGDADPEGTARLNYPGLFGAEGGSRG